MNISALAPTHDSGHWYRRDGTRCQEIISKTTSLPRRPNLGDARKLGLLPGVTTICKIYPGNGLQNCSPEILSAASDIGTRRHAQVEAFHLNHCTRIDPVDGPFLEPYYQWFGNTVERVTLAESVAISLDHGYAGTMDLLCVLKDKRVAVVDLKNRKNLATYDTDAMQLAAYRHAVGAGVAISVVLGTERPEILVKEWGTAENELAWLRFGLCLQLWKSATNYYPEFWEPNGEQE